jgi:hypothetical protein
VQILVPYVDGMLESQTYDAVKSEAKSVGWDLLFCQIDKRDTEAYWRLIKEWWGKGEGLVIVEHDVVPPEGAFLGFADCPEPWCSHSYHNTIHANTTIVNGLGCVRFSAELTKTLPDALVKVGQAEWGGMPRRHYLRLDSRLSRYLDETRYREWKGLAAHRHEPPAVHLHDYRKRP